MKKWFFFLIMMAIMCMVCFASANEERDFRNVTIRLAQQYGMQYAPVYVMQNLELLEKYLPGVKLEWSNLSSGAALNEALIAGQLDVAFMGVPPALIAMSKGVDYRISAGICVAPGELMIRDDSIKSIMDLKETDRIAVPGVGATQHILLAMAAEKFLGDANALDNNIMTMSHPDAYAALISGTDIVGHFASLPYIDLEAKAGCRSILPALETLGQGVGIVCVSTRAFHNQPEVYDGLIGALSEAIDLINDKDPATIKIIAETEKITEEAALVYVQWPGNIYDIKTYGVMDLAQFMFEQKYLDKYSDNIFDIMWENVVEHAE